MDINKQKGGDMGVTTASETEWPEIMHGDDPVSVHAENMVTVVW